MATISGPEPHRAAEKACKNVAWCTIPPYLLKEQANREEAGAQPCSSFFSKLNSDVRSMIYEELAHGEEKALSIEYRPGAGLNEFEWCPNALGSLMSTCRIALTEISPTLHKTVQFRVGASTILGLYGTGGFLNRASFETFTSISRRAAVTLSWCLAAFPKLEDLRLATSCTFDVRIEDLFAATTPVAYQSSRLDYTLSTIRPKADTYKLGTTFVQDFQKTSQAHQEAQFERMIRKLGYPLAPPDRDSIVIFCPNNGRAEFQTIHRVDALIDLIDCIQTVETFKTRREGAQVAHTQQLADFGHLPAFQTLAALEASDCPTIIFMANADAKWGQAAFDSRQLFSSCISPTHIIHLDLSALTWNWYQGDDVSKFGAPFKEVMKRNVSKYGVRPSGVA
ncbi:uncharacterized protein AB675_8915 [Cyphellophora attinorum]|uniref:Uncharacterized protein n=1 Tax=Cyphellophora attinorum TaxID=1664694 RepID=A0A0N1H3G0_9EURO|nr:uncharacterized protein AB675_8915 [Phialophora attinorum]KPI36110.1 hypothetical protein AB675_8915 [Phialophora attinorum]